jgi:hypothetical protein
MGLPLALTRGRICDRSLIASRQAASKHRGGTGRSDAFLFVREPIVLDVTGLVGLFFPNRKSVSMRSYAVASNGSILEVAARQFSSIRTNFPAVVSINQTGYVLFVGGRTLGTPRTVRALHVFFDAEGSFARVTNIEQTGAAGVFSLV